ncbi:MAG: sugar-binding protein [bacterium]
MSILQKIRRTNSKKHLSCIILIWIFSLVVLSNVYSQKKDKGKNWVINPGFEDGGNGWTLKEAEVISDEPFSGKNCVIIRGGDNNHAYQDIDVVPGKTYYFRCMVRTAKGKDVKWLAVVSEYQPKLTWLTTRSGQRQLVKWIETEAVTFIPKTNKIRVALFNYKGEGDVYYDEIYLSLDPPAELASSFSLPKGISQNLITNPSFEKPARVKENAAEWPDYYWGYTRSKEKSFRTESSGPWSCKITEPGKEEKGHTGGTTTVIRTGLPHQGSFTAVSRIYIDSYTQGKIYSTRLAIQYSDKTRKELSEFLSDKQIKENLHKWKTYTYSFSTDPDKKIEYIVFCCFVSIKTDLKRFKGTIYFDELELYETVPQVCISKTNSAPHIDGKLNDACWDKASALSEFSLTHNAGLAVNKTKAYLLYDENNLYIATQCYEKALDPIFQQTHLFRTEVKDRDGSLWNDDCIEIFIDPKGNGAYYHFIFNALGTRYDAFRSDKSWNGNWKVATSVETRSWKAEVSVPLSELGIKIGNNTRFRFNICREEKPLKENSAWSPMRHDFHEFARFGNAVLYDGYAPQIQAKNLEECLTEDIKNITFDINNKHKTEASLTFRLDSAQAIQGGELFTSIEKCSIPEGSKKIVEVPLLFKKTGAYYVSYSIFDTGTEKLLYQSPKYFTVKEEPIRASFETDFSGNVQLWVNNKPVTDTNFRFQPGINVIALKCRKEEGSTKGVLGKINIHANKNLPAQTIQLDNCWKVCSAKELNWTAQNFDDSKCSFATTLADGSIWGKDSNTQELCLRRLIVVGMSEFAIVDVSEGLHIAKGSAQHAFLIVRSPMKYPLKRQSVVIQTPSEIQLEGIIGEKKTVHQSIGKLTNVTVNSVDMNGEKFTSYRFLFENVQPFEEYRRSTHLLTLAFKLSRETSAKKVNLLYRMSGEEENRNITELWNYLPVICLPALTNKRPKKLKTEIYHTWTCQFNDTEIKAMLDTFRQAGFNAYGNQTAIHSWCSSKRDPWLEIALDQGFDVIVDSGHTKCFESIARNNPDATAINFDGKTIPYFKIKPVYIIGKGRNEVKKHIAEFFKWTKCNTLDLDYEYPPFVVCDTSEVTRKDFAAYAKLNNIPSKEEIKKQYREEWIDYKAYTWAEVVKVFSEAVKSVNPEAKMSVYSGYQGQKAHGCADWNYLVKTIDIAEAGYGRPLEKIKKTVEILGDIPLTAGICYFRNWQPPEKYKSLKNKILRRFTDGAHGFLLYTWELLEGRAYHKINEAVTILADFEEFFINNRKKQIDTFQVKGDIKREDVVLIEGKNEYLMLVYNDNNSQKSGEVLLPETISGMVVKDYPEGNKIGKAHSIKITIKPYDVKVILIQQ